MTALPSTLLNRLAYLAAATCWLWQNMLAQALTLHSPIRVADPTTASDDEYFFSGLTAGVEDLCEGIHNCASGYLQNLVTEIIPIALAIGYSNQTVNHANNTEEVDRVTKDLVVFSDAEIKDLAQSIPGNAGLHTRCRLRAEYGMLETLYVQNHNRFDTDKNNPRHWGQNVTIIAKLAGLNAASCKAALYAFLQMIDNKITQAKNNLGDQRLTEPAITGESKCCCCFTVETTYQYALSFGGKIGFFDYERIPGTDASFDWQANASQRRVAAVYVDSDAVTAGVVNSM